MYQSFPNNFGVPINFIMAHSIGINITLSNQCYYPEEYLIIKRQSPFIGVSLPTQREMRWIKDRESMEKNAQDKGLKIRIENADTDAKLQAKQVDELISEGINVLIIAPTDYVAAAPMVEKAKKAGIKVIDYDRLIPNSDIDLFISTDNIRVGEFQGRYLIGNVPKGNYIIMSGDPNDDNSMIFKEGAMEFIRPLVFNRDIKIVAEQAIINWDPENAYNIVKNALLANNNRINAILAPNDATAGGAIKALEEQGLAGKVAVTGQDADLPAIKRILEGTQSMTVLKDSRELGKIAIDSAIKLSSGQTVDANSSVNNGQRIVPAILVLPIFVTKNNIEDTIIKNGYWNKDEIYN